MGDKKDIIQFKNKIQYKDKDELIEIIQGIKDFHERQRVRGFNVSSAEIARVFQQEIINVKTTTYFLVVRLGFWYWRYFQRGTWYKLNLIKLVLDNLIANVSYEELSYQKTYWLKDWYIEETKRIEEKYYSQSDAIINRLPEKTQETKTNNTDEEKEFSNLLHFLAILKANESERYRNGKDINHSQIAEYWAEEAKKMKKKIPNFDNYGLSAESIRKKLQTAKNNSRNKDVEISF
ncbi:hypothetical protein [Stenoxybacter acetivorans]|uniref:hypothetical protein n=1 Tax=Stenoxybacter acetivorans TaxID=422441 RepID=UPI000560E51A|nr:hypothetical protein [Stenoxybacter acetivorans]